LARVVVLSDGSGRAEAWDGKSWGPTSVSFAEILKAPPASPATLKRRGVSTAL
jgi:hypothetical protein